MDVVLPLAENVDIIISADSKLSELEYEDDIVLVSVHRSNFQIFSVS